MPDQYEFRLHIQGPGSAWDFAIPLGITLIGRVARSALRLPYAEVSRQHARLIYTGTECQIEDLGSANGTILDGRRLSPNRPVPLIPGSTVRIGPCLLTLGSPAGQAPDGGAPDWGGAQLAKAASPPEALGQETISVEARATSDWSVEDVWEDGPQGPGRIAPPPPDGREGRPTWDPHEALPPGLELISQRLYRYLPDIYHTGFIMGYLALFERILFPVEWNIENFDLYLSPSTAPDSFLPWLARWFELFFDPTWSVKKRRLLLQEAHLLYARRGTRWTLSRILEIYTEYKPEIIEFEESLPPHTFRVRLPVVPGKLNRELIERLINASKPAQTSYTLEFVG